MRSVKSIIFSGALLLIAGGACAAPHGTLTFIQPTGSVGPLDSIDVRVRFTLDADSVPLIVDSTLPDYGLNAADFGADWPDEFGSASLMTSTLSICGHDFTGCGNDLPYRLESNDDPLGLLSSGTLALAPGHSREFSIGRFVPNVGLVPIDTYGLGLFDISLTLTGTRLTSDEFGNPVFESGSIGVLIASSCVEQDVANCPGFVRSVVPLPPMLAPMAVGLVAVYGMRRRTTQRH